MNALRDYAEWCQFAGIYPRNFSHGDRYRTYAENLSQAGCAALIVDDFLQSQRAGIDLKNWRSYDVYEIGGDLTFRIEQTAKAFEAIGAPRVAARVRTVEDNSIGGQLMQMMGDAESLTDMMENVDPNQLMADLQAKIAHTFPDAAAGAGVSPPDAGATQDDPEIESADEIARLLAAYVEAHADELRADMQRHGDPRTEPGFDPDERMQQLEETYTRQCRDETEQEDVEKLQELMQQFGKRAAKVNGNPKKLASLRRKLNELTRTYRKQQPDELSAGMQACLADVGQLESQYPDVFQLRVTDDSALLERMAALGDYTVDDSHGLTFVEWSKPPGFETEWARFSMTVHLPEKDDRALSLLLDACERLQRRFPAPVDEVRQQVVDSFEAYRQWMDDGDDFDEELEFDADGNPTEESVLKMVDGAGVTVSIPGWPHDDAVAIDGFISVEWDDEHGVEFFVEDESEEAPAVETGTIPDHVTFRDTGPVLSEADLMQFEATSQVQLPKEYCAFLRLVNGGRPEPNHLQLSLHGQTVPIDIVCLFGIGANQPEHDLRTAIERHRQRHFPDEYLPVGLLTVPDPVGGQMACTFYLRTTGSQAGTIQVCLTNFDAEFPPEAIGENPDPATRRMIAQVFSEWSQRVAGGIFPLLAKLTAPPEVEFPDWLAAIREDDVERFLKWQSAGGRLDEQFTEYGTFRPLTVVDALAVHATVDFLQSVMDDNLVRPRQLRERWSMWSQNASRFETLMQVLPANQYRYVFLAANVWDLPGILSQIEAAGIDLDEAIDEEGGTPLHHAVMHGRADGVRWLLDHGASPSKPDDYQRTALVWAEDGRQLDCLLQLLDAGESLESLFPHMPTMKDKLKLIESRWMDQYPALRTALEERQFDVGE
ncbi:Ankyrin repeats (3 copies) [Maioricimonas rarisocia]|uniref:Ankyrin repeats (3 copies) n=1 Tax=Maioricimonas rarisocia TaxID=2528026 RepID=A0A517ZEQ8_9PLAN|nr:ankyrin repeat domain-containing protein [Maioricimonas rarisocia]QDU40909.1 Ankyrin repeats (3 copies) [Maioricimonas rarisocia]